MVLEAVLLLLGAQLMFASPPAPTPTSPALSFPSIDQAARENELAVAPFATGAVQEPLRPAEPNLGTPAVDPGHWTGHHVSAGVGPQFSLAGYPQPASPTWMDSESLNAEPFSAEPLDPMSLNAASLTAASLNAASLNVMSLNTEPHNAGLAHSVWPPAQAESLTPEHGLHPRWRRVKHWLGRRAGCDYGLAYERVMVAPIMTETALGVPSAGLRFRYNRGASSPDRLEYLWARSGKGPGPESGVDMFDSVFRTELGNARAVVISEISMRSLDPERAPNTTGFGDMVVGGKTLLFDGKCSKLSSIFLSYLNTGPADRGLGTGHVSLEPGLLGLHQWSEQTFLHGAIQYRIPISGSRGFAGDVLTTSWAVSSVWQDSDAYAWIPVLEIQTHSFLFGAQTLPDGSIRRVDGTTALDILPGSRWALGQSAFGLCELGLSGGFRCSDSDWFDSRMMMDIRWVR